MNMMNHNEFSKQQIDEVLFNVLKRVYWYERQIEEILGLNYQQIYLLQILRRNSPIRVGDIAAELQIPLFQVTRLVNKLVEKQMVEKTQFKNDRRGVLVSLLSEGESILQLVEERSYNRIMMNAHKMTDEEIRCFFVAATQIDLILGDPNKGEIE
jgi:DNA-binding MarR family transcriptional regulator